MFTISNKLAVPFLRKTLVTLHPCITGISWSMDKPEVARPLLSGRVRTRNHASAAKFARRLLDLMPDPKIVTQVCFPIHSFFASSIIIS